VGCFTLFGRIERAFGRWQVEPEYRR